MKKYKTLFFLFCFWLLLLTSSYTHAVSISIPSVSVNTGECFAINVNLYKTEEEDIRTLVVAFSFDLTNIQIGCTRDILENTTDNEPFVYEEGIDLEEPPIIVNNGLSNLGFKFRLAIYKPGVMIVVFWNGTNSIPAGPLFTVPCKLTSRVNSGAQLPISLIPETEPVFINRTFSDNSSEMQSFYCSVADANALPLDTTLVSGTVYVKTADEGNFEGQTQEGEGNSIEGQIQEGEGSPNEGHNEGNAQEGEGYPHEGNLEGQTQEGEGSPNEGSIDEGKITCGCGNTPKTISPVRLSVLQILEMHNLNFGLMIALVVILRRL